MEDVSQMQSGLSPRKDRWALAIPALAACFSFTLLFFAPLELYLGNRQEFWFSLETLLPVFIGLFLLSTGLITGILFCFRGRARVLLTALLFALTLGVYIQGNYMAGGYPLLTGAEIDWSERQL